MAGLDSVKSDFTSCGRAPEGGIISRMIHRAVAAYGGGWLCGWGGYASIWGARKKLAIIFWLNRLPIAMNRDKRRQRDN